MTRIGSSPSPAFPASSQSLPPGEGRFAGPGSVAPSAAPTSSLTSPGASAPGANGTSGPSAFARLVGSLGQEANRGEVTMKKALSAGGSQLGASDLLALQAGVYRYGEVIDLSSRLVDHATSDVKSVLQGQGS